MYDLSDYQEELADLDISFEEALRLLEICRMCDLVYNYRATTGDFSLPDDGKRVFEVVDEFLKKHGK